ncbi:MAG: hypothetical protein ACK5LV_02185 [Lachnospirales bacterium]
MALFGKSKKDDLDEVVETKFDDLELNVKSEVHKKENEFDNNEDEIESIVSYRRNERNKPVNFKELPDVAKILTNNYPLLINETKLLVDDYNAYVKQHLRFCKILSTDLDDKDKNIPIFFAHMLTTKRKNVKYGTYVGWKMTFDEIVSEIEALVLNYLTNKKIDLKSLAYVNKNDANNVLEVIDEYLKKEHLTLVKLTLESTSFYIFVAPMRDIFHLKAYGDSMKIQFVDTF